VSNRKKYEFFFSISCLAVSFSRKIFHLGLLFFITGSCAIILTIINTTYLLLHNFVYEDTYVNIVNLAMGKNLHFNEKIQILTKIKTSGFAKYLIELRM